MSMTGPIPSSPRSTRARPSTRELQKKCDRFNDRAVVGTKVRVKRDNGDVVETTTRSAAHVLGGHTAVVFVDGISGCYALERVEIVV
jgi:hypothetical protein